MTAKRFTLTDAWGASRSASVRNDEEFIYLSGHDANGECHEFRDKAARLKAWAEARREDLGFEVEIADQEETAK